MLKTDRKEGQHERKVRTRNTVKVKGKQEMKTRKKKQRVEKRGNVAIDISHYTNYTQPTVKGLDKRKIFEIACKD